MCASFINVVDLTTKGVECVYNYKNIKKATFLIQEYKLLEESI